MTTTESNLHLADITDKIISAAYDVHNQLGFGFAEKVYENAMMIKLASKGLQAGQQAPISVFFEEKLVGEYFADLLVEDAVIVELKAVSELAKIHEAQLINYLKATGKKVGLLINFADKLKIVRRVL
ncbi:MAG: GxxExxY protein [Nitrospirota bacterium]|nr:GxxExxY protein [Nitrospirota bacterium]